jgi:enoyl-CoA hydratase/carnithine racemase
MIAEENRMATMKAPAKLTQMNAPAKPEQIRVTKRSPAYWRVTIDNPPINVMGPEMVKQFQEVIAALEADEQVRVVVFDSAVDDYFLNHSDFTAKLEDLTSLPDGPTGLPPWPDFLARLTRLPVASIALIRGRATGNGSEITLACDMSFASREKPSSRNGRWAWEWLPAADPWPGFPDSSAETAPSRCC